ALTTGPSVGWARAASTLLSASRRPAISLARVRLAYRSFQPHNASLRRFSGHDLRDVFGPAFEGAAPLGEVRGLVVGPSNAGPMPDMSENNLDDVRLGAVLVHSGADEPAKIVQRPISPHATDGLIKSGPRARPALETRSPPSEDMVAPVMRALPEDGDGG